MSRHKLVITDRALADLRDIRDYIAKSSPANATRMLERLLAEFDAIEATPEAFGVAPEDDCVPFTLRQFVVKPYRVLYRVVDKRVDILHVRHGARAPVTPEELA